MKLLLDQGLPRSAAALLRAVGIDTVHLSEIGASAADDAAILQLAKHDDRIVVPLDADFHALLALSKAKGPSVVRIRIEGLRAPSVSTLLQDVVARCDHDLEQGAVVTVQEGRLRVRLLPLLP